MGGDIGSTNGMGLEWYKVFLSAKMLNLFEMLFYLFPFKLYTFLIGIVNPKMFFFVTICLPSSRYKSVYISLLDILMKAVLGHLDSYSNLLSYCWGQW